MVNNVNIYLSLYVKALSRQNSMSMEDMLSQDQEYYGTPKPTPIR